VIEVKSIYKSYDNRFVLNDVNVRFEQGKCNLIIGRSGSGKTVLLKSIVGLIEPDSGEIWYDDLNFCLLSSGQKRAIRREMGMLFQGAALFDSLTVEENVKFPLNIFTKLSNREKQQRVDYCLDRVKVREANALHPSEISGGMKKRVAIARAIALSPKYLFCDEPNSGLDPETGIVIDQLIQELTQELNTTTIINSHDMNSVLEIGDHVIFIYQGCLCWEGSKKEVLESDNEALNNFVFATNMARQIKK